MIVQYYFAIVIKDVNIEEMKSKVTLIFLLMLFRSNISSPVSEPNSMVVVTTEDPDGKENIQADGYYDVTVNPQIYSMEIRSNISNRFATTLITSRVLNSMNNAEETTFSVILPENAFISEFLMETDDKVYKAYVKEKEEAKKIYQEAASRGRSAAHVELSARESKTFTVSVNIEPESEIIFKLTYEELLQRKLGQYELIINIHPGQVVDNLDVEVYITESRWLTFVRTPSLRTGNEISKNEESLKPSTNIEKINKTSAIVKFHPDKEQQRKFADLLGSQKENGLAGQFVVQYEVERDPQGGEVLIRDGYFVHFFSPCDLEPIPKHVVFLLDHSVSMKGRKIDQLIDAMQNILSDLYSEDLFHMVRFGTEASVWDIKENKFRTVNILNPNYGYLEPHLRVKNLPEAVMVTPENINKAKQVIKDKRKLGATNIIAGLEVGLFLTKRTQEKTPNRYQPMILFLTDGLPNGGINSVNEIVKIVTKLNSEAPVRTSIFSLSFGEDADKNLLKNISLKNAGFPKHIFEAADASLQLQNFYRTISSPSLSYVTFKYVDEVTDVTNTHYPLFFSGSELVIAGRINTTQHEIVSDINGRGKNGLIRFTPVQKEPVSSIERLWAYLTVKQLLKEKGADEISEEMKEKALNLALKYSFVTEVTSLVVVRPDGSETVQTDSNGHGKAFFTVPNPTQKSLVAHNGPHLATSPPHSSSFNRFYISSRFGDDEEESPRPLWGTTNRGPFHLAPSSTTSAPTTAVTAPTTAATSTNDTMPKWLEDLQVNSQNVTTPRGVFLLGKSGDATIYRSCPKTPANEIGECKIIFDCPQIFSLLTDLNTYLQYFCPLGQYAGVCCPKSTLTSEEDRIIFE